MAIIIWLNAIVSIASIVASVIAYVMPERLSGSVHTSSGERFYVSMYAVRSIPLEASAAVLPFVYTSPVVAWVVFIAAAVQGADVGIGLSRRRPAMVIAAGLGAIIHVMCGYHLA